MPHARVLAAPPKTYAASFGASSAAAPETAAGASPPSSRASRVVHSNARRHSTAGVPGSFLPLSEPCVTHICGASLLLALVFFTFGLSTTHAQWWYRGAGGVPRVATTRHVSIGAMASSSEDTAPEASAATAASAGAFCALFSRAFMALTETMSPLSGGSFDGWLMERSPRDQGFTGRLEER